MHVVIIIITKNTHIRTNTQTHTYIEKNKRVKDKKIKQKR